MKNWKMKFCLRLINHFVSLFDNANFFTLQTNQTYYIDKNNLVIDFININNRTILVRDVIDNDKTELSNNYYNTQLYVEPDVIGTSNNVSLFAEMSTYTAKTILPLGISTSNPSQSLNSSVISTQAIAATTTITPISGLVQAQIHTIGSINKTSY